MGQGTESCGGYEVDYEPHFDDTLMGSGLWLQKDGSTIKVSDMTTSHLRNVRRLVVSLAETSTFSCDSNVWSEWVEIFDDELYSRSELHFHIPKYTSPDKVKTTRGKKVELICYCDTIYFAKVADLKRGYGRSCCKSCAAKKRKYNNRDPIVKETGELLSKKFIKGL